MSSMPPGWVLLLVLVLLSALAGWVLQRAAKNQPVPAAQTDLQTQTQRHIQRQHLAELDQALAVGQLSPEQHAAARDELMRQVLSDAAMGHGRSVVVPGSVQALTQAPLQAPLQVPLQAPVRVVWIALSLALLSGLTYLQLGESQTWWPQPLSQRVQVSADTPEALAEQTAQWTQKLAAQPDDAHAWLTLARLHAAANAPALAEQALARVLALSPEPDLWIERAQMKAQSAGGVYAGEPWQWINSVLTVQPLHLNALVLAGSAALSEKRPDAALAYWQKALSQVPPDSEAAQGLAQAVAQATEMAQAAPSKRLAAAGQALIQGEVRVSPEVQSQIAAGASLLVYALAEDGARRPVAIWRTTPTRWPVPFVLSDSMGMGAPPLLSDLKQVRLVARISKTGAAQRQADDFQVELPGVKTGVQGVVLHITRPIP